MKSDIVPSLKNKKIKNKIVVLFNSPTEENLGLNPPPSLNLREKKVIWSHVPIMKRDNNNNNI